MVDQTMSRLTKTRLRDGVWEGVLTHNGSAAPDLRVTHLEMELADVSVVKATHETWQVRVPVPSSSISDGVQTFVIQDRGNDETLATFHIAAGSPLAEDLRAEVSLLRAELDMLKRAFRRHCVETGA